MNRIDRLINSAIQKQRPINIPRLHHRFSKGQICQAIDHTLLNPDATEGHITQLCDQAVTHTFAAVCVNPVWASLCHRFLQSRVKTCVVVGFPLGATSRDIKVAETESAVMDGADEIDMVINIGWLKDKRYHAVFKEIRAVVSAADTACVKVILETCLLTREEKIAACVISQEAGAGFVKTSTGFSKHGAVIEDVTLMRSAVADHMGVKAAGGIRTLQAVKKMLSAGANRIGTSSGLNIVRQLQKESDQ